MERAILTLRGVAIPKAALAESVIDGIKNELTVSPIANNPYQNVPKYPIYRESPNKIYLPKFYAIKKFGCPIPVIKYKGLDIDIEFQGTLRPEQYTPVNDVIDACKDPMRMGGVLNVFCGGGKTTMALCCIASLKKKAVIIVHKDFLLNQWKERIEQFLPQHTRIGYVKGKVNDIADKDIILASLQSLSMKDYDIDLFKDCGTLVIDEVHHTSAEVFNKALFKTSLMYTIGLSATVDRKDGLSKVFMWHLGDIVFKTETRKEEQVIVNAIKINDNNDKEYSGEEYIGFGSNINFSRMINKVCAYGPRVHHIVNILNEIPPGRKTLVLSDRVQHLKEIMLHMQDGEKTCGLYIGGMKSSALKACETKDIIFATFAIASEGYDQKDLDTLVLASPKSDVVQSVGRILRSKEEDRSNIPTIYDIIDNFSVFEKQWFKRRAFYRKSNYKIYTTKYDI
jgi:superfamily II DNA or RNA helicase